MSFDYHREMTDALSGVDVESADDLVWIMNAEHRAKYRWFLENVMGVDPDDSQSFGIEIQTGEPSNGQPFELIRRRPH